MSTSNWPSWKRQDRIRRPSHRPDASRAGDDARSSSATTSLDALIDADGARSRSATARRSRCRPRVDEAEVLAALRALADAQRGAHVAHRHRLLGHDHAAGDPAQRAREPRVVHGVHAVPAGDLPGPARGAAELPDDGHRPHRHGGRERVAARRGHRGGGGDGAVPPGERATAATPSSSTPTAIRRRSRSSRRGPSRSASTSWSATSTPTSRATACSACCCSTRGRAARCATTARSSSTLHAQGALVAVATDLLALVLLRPAGGVGRRRRGRLGPALRRAARLRRTARRVHGHARRAQAHPAGPPRRRVGRPGRPSGAAPRAPDARAAHPAREGHQQHLHRAGAPRGDRRAVRHVPRPRRPARASRRRVHRLTAVARRRPARAAASRSSPTTFFDTITVRVPGRADAVLAAARDRRHQPARGRRRHARHRARRDDDRRHRGRGVDCVRPPGRPSSRR